MGVSVFQNSPGVYSSEIDQTGGTVPAVDTSAAAIAGVFKWGPVNQRVLVDQETTLVKSFGTPSNFNAETWFSAANFLSYSNELYVVRVANTSGNTSNVLYSTLSAVAGTSNTPSNTILLECTVENLDDLAETEFDPSVYYTAKYPGGNGNSLRISVCDSPAAYSSNIALIGANNINATATGVAYVVGSNTATITIIPSSTGTSTDTGNLANTIVNSLTIGDLIAAGNSTVGQQFLKITSIGASTLNGANASVVLQFSSPFTQSTNAIATSIPRSWEFINSVNKAPTSSPWQIANGNTAVVDQVHVVVQDQDGIFTGVPGKILEVFDSLSRATDAQNETGQSIYYAQYLNNGSNYVWRSNDISNALSNTAINLVNSTNIKPTSISFVGGQDGLGESAIPLSTIASGYNLFVSPEDVDISLIIQGKAFGGTNGEGLANYIISNIATVRNDCLVCVSPEYADVVNQAGLEAENIIQFRQSINSTSYATIDSGYKYQYDQYNDVYRYIPLNGDIAGIIARTDAVAYAWYSPGGFNRGNIKNVIKFAYNPKQSDRDLLYKNDINPCVNFNNQGPVLYGDKTALGTTSAFSRIGVRRLFIILRKAISIASQAFLFEFNDSFTQQQFINVVDPYLRGVQGNRGITAYQIVCDSTNNTPDVVNNEGFVGDIYVIPARSINVIQLNFTAVQSGISFSEIINQNTTISQ